MRYLILSILLAVVFNASAGLRPVNYSIVLSIGTQESDPALVEETFRAVCKRLEFFGKVDAVPLVVPGEPTTVDFTGSIIPDAARSIVSRPGELTMYPAYKFGELEEDLVRLRELLDSAENLNLPPSAEFVSGSIFLDVDMGYVRKEDIKPLLELLGHPVVRSIFPYNMVPAVSATPIADDIYTVYFLKKQGRTPLLWNDMILDANIEKRDHSAEIIIVLDSAGAGAFADLTGNNVGNNIAIRIDGRVVTIPRVVSQIDGGRMSIFMGDEIYDPQILAFTAMLRGGRLKLPVKVLSVTPPQQVKRRKR